MNVRSVFSCFFALLLLAGVAPVVSAHQEGGTPTGENSDVTLEVEMAVSKVLDRVVDGPKGKEHHYFYVVNASPLPPDVNGQVRLSDPKFTVSYETHDFKENDTIQLISETDQQTEASTFIYEVVYIGSGTRSVDFEITATTNIYYAPLPADEDPCACTPSCVITSASITPESGIIPIGSTYIGCNFEIT